MTIPWYRFAMILSVAVLVLPHAASAAPACAAVFEFEMIDHSLEGEIKGAKPEEQQRLQLITTQLRQWVDAGSGWKSCDMTAVAAEAQAANLSYCGCVPRLTQAVGGKVAIVGSVHKVSNLILNIQVDVFDAETNRLLLQQNADIRSNTDASWKRGLDWLIKHRLVDTFAALGDL
jgi:hypothetical protein